MLLGQGVDIAHEASTFQSLMIHLELIIPRYDGWILTLLAMVIKVFKVHSRIDAWLLIWTHKGSPTIHNNSISSVHCISSSTVPLWTKHMLQMHIFNCFQRVPQVVGLSSAFLDGLVIKLVQNEIGIQGLLVQIFNTPSGTRFLSFFLGWFLTFLDTVNRLLFRAVFLILETEWDRLLPILRHGAPASCLLLDLIPLLIIESFC